MISAELTAAFAVLGLTTSATESDVRAAYRSRASLLHPDVHQHRGDLAVRQASDAMRQLTDAYQLAMSYAKKRTPHGSPPSEEGPGGRPQPESRKAPPDDGSDREFCYATSRWAEADRNSIGRVLSLLSVPHRWEQRELIVEIGRDKVVDHVVAAFDELFDARAQRRPDETEILFELASTNSPNRSVMQSALTEMAVPWTMEGAELIVDKRYETCVEEMLAAVEPR